MIELLNHLIKQVITDDNISKIKCDSILEIFNSIEILVEIAQNDKSETQFNYLFIFSTSIKTNTFFLIFNRN
jgi:hypothetical protein